MELHISRNARTRETQVLRFAMPDIYLGLDVGDVRIGVALSRSGVICEPLTTIEANGKRGALDAIEKLVVEHNATVCVIGLPLLEGGTVGEQAEKTQAFARSLARRLPRLRIELRDERYTSSQARDIAGGRRVAKEAKGLVDRLAAAVILQEYLDALAAQAARAKKTD